MVLTAFQRFVTIVYVFDRFEAGKKIPIHPRKGPPGTRGSLGPAPGTPGPAYASPRRESLYSAFAAQYAAPTLLIPTYHQQPIL